MNGRIVTVAVERGELLTSTSYNQLSEAASFTEVYRRLVSLSLILLPTTRVDSSAKNVPEGIELLIPAF